MVTIGFDFEKGELICPVCLRKLAGGWFARAIFQEGMKTKGICVVGRRLPVMCSDCRLPIPSPLFYDNRDLCVAILEYGIIRELLALGQCSHCSRKFSLEPSFIGFSEELDCLKIKEVERNKFFLKRRRFVEESFARMQSEIPCHVCGGIAFFKDNGETIIPSMLS